MVSNQYDYCIVASRTDVGCKRAANEDSMGQLDTINGRVVVVCDGMGGHVGGATASKIAVETILEFLNGQRFDDIREGMGMAIDAANRAILAYANVHPELTGMGSTCVLLVIREGLVYIAHVGDSRIYLVRNRIITQLTKDHSYVQMLVDNGEITKEQAEHHPRKNEITNALGIPQMTPATVKEDAILPEAGDSFLLCSDGLSGPVEEKVINKIISDHTIRVQQRVDMLIEKARENGGPDNITAQVVEFVMTPKDSLDNKKKKIHPAIWYVLGSVVLIAIGITLFFVLKRQTNVTDNKPTENDVILTSQPTEQEEKVTTIVPPTTTTPSSIPPQEDLDKNVVEPKLTIESYLDSVSVGDSVVIRKMKNQWSIYIGGRTTLINKKWHLSRYEKIDFSIDNLDTPTLYVWRNNGQLSKEEKYVVTFTSGNDKQIFKIVAKKGELEDQIVAVSPTASTDNATNNNTTSDPSDDKQKAEATDSQQNKATEESANTTSDDNVEGSTPVGTVTDSSDTQATKEAAKGERKKNKAIKKSEKTR